MKTSDNIMEISKILDNLTKTELNYILSILVDSHELYAVCKYDHGFGNGLNPVIGLQVDPD